MPDEAKSFMRFDHHVKVWEALHGNLLVSVEGSKRVLVKPDKLDEAIMGAIFKEKIRDGLISDLHETFAKPQTIRQSLLEIFDNCHRLMLDFNKDAPPWDVDYYA